jgi:hypothetical protein
MSDDDRFATLEERLLHGHEQPANAGRDGIAAALAAWDRLPQAAIDDRRAFPEVPLADRRATVPYDAPFRRYSGTLAPGHDIPPQNITNPLSRAAGATDIANTPRYEPLREVWMPAGSEVSVPKSVLDDLYGPGEYTVTGRRLSQ